MLVYDEESFRTMTMFIEIPRKGEVLTVMKEERQYTREYKD